MFKINTFYNSTFEIFISFQVQIEVQNSDTSDAIMLINNLSSKQNEGIKSSGKFSYD